MFRLNNLVLSYRQLFARTEGNFSILKDIIRRQKFPCHPQSKTNRKQVKVILPIDQHGLFDRIVFGKGSGEAGKKYS